LVARQAIVGWFNGSSDEPEGPKLAGRLAGQGGTGRDKIDAKSYELV